MAQNEYLPPLLNEETERYIKKTAADTLIPYVFDTIITWGCPKKPTQSYLEYLQEIIPATKWPRHCKRWSERELLQLQEKNCSTFDVTFMLNLIPEVCPSIAKKGDKIWTIPDDTKIENLLFQLKEFRNKINHGSAPTVMDSLKILVDKVFNIAGNKYSVIQEEIQKQITNFSSKIDQIGWPVMTEKERNMNKLRNEIFEECINEIEATVDLEATDRLPCSTAEIRRYEIFHPPRFMIERKKDNTSESFVVPCDELLSHVRESSVIVTGQPGSGKSTLLRVLREEFVLPKLKFFKGLSDYSLLLFMECRDTTLYTVPELLRKNFPKAFKNIDDDRAVEVFRMLKLLIVVDGIDELNPQSKDLLDDLVDMFGTYGGASFIFTSRPGAIEILMRNLNVKRITWVTAAIQPLSNVNEQIEFLNRYLSKIEGINGPALIDAFKTLEDPCINCLVQPVYLSLICHLFRSSPNVVAQWKNELGIMEQTMKLSVDFIRKRLCVEGVQDENDQNELSSKLVAALCDLACWQLLKNDLTIDQQTYRRLCTYSFGSLDVDYYVIMSCMLVGHSNKSSFQYILKTQTEFLAAKAIFKKLNTVPEVTVMGAIYKVLEDYKTSVQDTRKRRDEAGPRISSGGGGGDGECQLSTEEACRYDRSFMFLIMMLLEAGTDKQDLFKRCLGEICRLLTDGNTPFSYWAELCLSCPYSEDVKEAVAQAAATVSSNGANEHWKANSPRYMRAATAMLELHQPAGLYVTTSPGAATSALTPLLQTTGELYWGALALDLAHSYMGFIPVDDLLAYSYVSLPEQFPDIFSAGTDDGGQNLHGICRCAILQFCCCLEGSGISWKVFMTGSLKALKRGFHPVVLISLLNPRQHQLDCLHNTSHTLDVRVRTTGSDCDRRRRPLPISKIQPPRLLISCTQGVEDSAAKAIALTEDLAPDDKLYGGLWLLHWRGTEDELTSLVESLSKAGLRTPHHGTRRWGPATADRKGTCYACNEQHQHGEICVEVNLCEPDPRDPASKVEVNTSQEMADAVHLLQQRQPDWLEVVTYKSQEAPPALPSLMEVIGAEFRGSLDLRLLHSRFHFVPVDDLLVHLHQARCSLVTFAGCLRGNPAEAWLALLAAVGRALQAGMKPDLFISLLEPRQHKLDQLEGTRHQLVVTARLPLSPCLRSRRPLPASTISPPLLALDCAPTDGIRPAADQESTADRAAALIEDLAPLDMMYSYIHLQNWPGSTEALDQLLTDLLAAGVRTQDFGGQLEWDPSGTDTDGRCVSCREYSHRQGERCVKLRLPPSTGCEETVGRD